MWLTVATVVQFVILGVLALVVLSLARQIGILHERTAPAALARSGKSLQIGEVLPPTTAPRLSGGEVTLGHAVTDAAAAGATELTSAARKTLLLFIGTDCPICKSVLPVFHQILAQHADEFVGYLVGDGIDIESYAAYADEQQVDQAGFIVSQELGLTLGVRQLPTAVVLDEDSQLTLSETVSGPRQLEKLLIQAASPPAMPSGEKST